MDMISPLEIKSLAANISYTYKDTLGSISIILKEQISDQFKIELIQDTILKCNATVESLKRN